MRDQYEVPSKSAWHHSGYQKKNNDFLDKGLGQNGALIRIILSILHY